ncbi:MAG TPA: sensor histidine kinase [Burkholderiaceae bacterium]|nr:sensor histidine kinase [Burkholderiaceae bacterium]
MALPFKFFMALNSIRSTLLWILLPGVVLTSVLSLWVSSVELTDRVNAAFDRALAGALQSIALNVNTESGGLAMEQPFYMLEFIELATDSRVYFRVSTEDGLSEIGYSELPIPEYSVLEDGRPHFYNGEYFGEPLRLAIMAIGPSERLQTPLDSRIIIQVGESTTGRDEFIHRVLLQAVRKDFALLLLFVILISVGAILALRPLRETSEVIHQRASGNLQPINESSLPREVRPLIRAINLHMERYARKTTTQQQFLDDTSHQLRTPLSVLMMQVEYAKSLARTDEMKEVLEAIQQRLNNTIQLTNQMMALGRVHDAADKLRSGESLEEVDLCAVARDVVNDFLAAAREKRQDFGLDLPDTPIVVQGIGWLLHQALSNMVSNAIKYSPAQARITVSAYRVEEGAVLQVEDNGPGMSAEDIALAGHRFRRGEAGRAQHGSGLGLAIVQTIADINNARIELEPANGQGGLIARLTFQLPATVLYKT